MENIDFFKEIDEFINNDDYTSIENEEAVANKLIENYMIQCLKEEDEDFSDDMQTDIRKIKEKFSDKEEMKKRLGFTVSKYIDKCINYKKDVESVEPIARKVLRISLSVIFVVGPLVIPGNKILRLIAFIVNLYIANKVNNKKREKLIDMYEDKIKLLDEKIDETDDQKEKLEYKRIQKAMNREIVKLRRSIITTDKSYTFNHNKLDL
jgi:hypothetical protein